MAVAANYHSRTTTTRSLTVRDVETGSEDVWAGLLRDAVREADDAGVPDIADVTFSTQQDGFIQVITFTWSESHDETPKED